MTESTFYRSHHPRDLKWFLTVISPSHLEAELTSQARGDAPGGLVCSGNKSKCKQVRPPHTSAKEGPGFSLSRVHIAPKVTSDTQQTRPPAAFQRLFIPVPGTPGVATASSVRTLIKVMTPAHVPRGPRSVSWARGLVVRQGLSSRSLRPSGEANT